MDNAKRQQQNPQKYPFIYYTNRKYNSASYIESIKLSL